MSKSRDYIPDTAKVVFHGKTYDVWQWEQEMYDGRKKTFEKIKRKNEVGVIAVVDGQIVIQDQEQPHRDPFISVPGGTCDAGEDPYDTARRELLEETGYTSDNMIVWQVIPSPYSSIIREAYYFIAKDCKKTHELNLDNGEKIRNKLISFEEFLLLSENNQFRNTDLLVTLLTTRLHPEKKEELKNLLFS